MQYWTFQNGAFRPLAGGAETPNGDVGQSKVGTPYAWPTNNYTLSQYTLTYLQPASVHVEQVFMTDRLVTVQEAFGAAFWAAPPPSWTQAPGIDGVVPTAGFRLLLTAQSEARDNGIWEVAASGTSLVRPVDYAVGMNAGANFVKVNGPGLANDDQGWLCTTLPGSDVVGTHPTAWVIYTSANGKVGDLTLAGSQLTSASGQISLVNNSLVTTGSLAASSSALGTVSR